MEEIFLKVINGLGPQTGVELAISISETRRTLDKTKTEPLDMAIAAMADQTLSDGACACGLFTLVVMLAKEVKDLRAATTTPTETVQ